MAVMSNEHLQVALSIGSSLGIFGETEPLQTLVDCLGCIAPKQTSEPSCPLGTEQMMKILPAGSMRDGIREGKGRYGLTGKL